MYLWKRRRKITYGALFQQRLFRALAKGSYPKGAPAWLVMHALADKKGDVLLCKRRGLLGWLVATVMQRDRKEEEEERKKNPQTDRSHRS
jgi:hypothetical protein